MVSKERDEQHRGGEEAADRDAQLMEKFREWDESGKSVPLGDDPDLEPGEQHDAGAALHQARRALRLRVAALAVIVAVCVFSLYSTRQEAAFFFANDTPHEVGNVRDLYGKDVSIPEQIEHNSYVHVEGLVITRTAETDKYVYFLCPIGNIIVRTARELPEKSRLMTLPVDARLLDFIQERRLFPHDLSASFEVTGRAIRLDEAPGWARNIVSFYGNAVTAPPDEAYLIVDAEEPGDNVWYVVLYGVAALLLASGVYFLIRAIRRVRLAEDSL